mmetsp:Transcript_12726/g.20373  ORF Transcript_12726/g.20373 Transcript_12726/m.20373 type:complete len:430 (-) Transcript_12726:314-1603(-)
MSASKQVRDARQGGERIQKLKKEEHNLKKIEHCGEGKNDGKSITEGSNARKSRRKNQHRPSRESGENVDEKVTGAHKRSPPISEELLEAISCDIENVEQAPKIVKEFGVCVIKNVADKSEVAEAVSLFWKWIRSTGLPINKDDAGTMANSHWKKLGFARTGVMTRYHVGQSDFLWYCRQLPGVQKLFSELWGTDELITSFDGCGAMRNPFFQTPSGKGREDWCTSGGWYHLDQNGLADPGFELWQGLLNLFPATPLTGSTVVVPQSHRQQFTKIFRNRYHRKSTRAFVMLNKPGDYEAYCATNCQLRLDPGDFVIWDSRTVHCSQGMDRRYLDADTLKENATDLDRKIFDSSEPLSRLVAYVCMVPKKRLCDHDKCSALRIQAVKEGLTLSHHPIVRKLAIRSREAMASKSTHRYKPPKGTSKAWDLVS